MSIVKNTLREIFWGHTGRIFNVLGIKFSTDLNEMIKNNYNDKIREIETLLTQWTKIILTPY